MQYDASYWVLLRQIARGTRSNRAAVEDYVVGADVEVLRQVEVHRLDVIVERLVAGYAPIALSKARILVHDTIHIDLLQEVCLQPLLDEVDILGVTMADNDGVLGIAIDEKNLKLASTLAMQEQVVRVHGEARNWRLKENLRNESLSHFC